MIKFPEQNITAIKKLLSFEHGLVSLFWVHYQNIFKLSSINNKEKDNHSCQKIRLTSLYIVNLEYSNVL